jgi:transcriptional regulator with XRE-family HTH domain
MLMDSLRLTPVERERLAERLHAARQVAGKTIRGTAEALGVNVNSVIQWEHGSLPGPDNRAKLAVFYGIDEDILFAEYVAHMDANRALIARPA